MVEELTNYQQKLKEIISSGVNSKEDLDLVIELINSKKRIEYEMIDFIKNSIHSVFLSGGFLNDLMISERDLEALIVDPATFDIDITKKDLLNDNYFRIRDDVDIKRKNFLNSLGYYMKSMQLKYYEVFYYNKIYANTINFLLEKNKELTFELELANKPKVSEEIIKEEVINE